MAAEALFFDPVGHRYELAGRELPSVTTILDPYTGLDYVDRDTLEAARELGTDVHAAVHYHNTGQLEHCPERIKPYLDGWIRFLAETGAVVLASECRVYSQKHGFAGTLDSLIYWKNREHIVDVKSGSVVPKTVGPQLAGYLTAYNELHGTKVRSRQCVHLLGDGTYRLHEQKDARDSTIFQSALNLWRWRNS